MRQRYLGLSVLLAGVLVVPAVQAEQKDDQAPARVVQASAVNLNTATISQLESLPGIGPRIAERIVAYREKTGGFKKIEELMNVQGVGEKSFLRIKDLITITPPKTKDAGSTPKQ
jgi:competence protein ComEA